MLEKITEKRQSILDSEDPQLGQLKLNEYDVVQFDSPKSWRLTKAETRDEEAIFQIQGILCAVDLPPVSRVKNIESKRLFIKQAVRITGLSTEAFKKAASACQHIHAKMATDISGSTMNPWQDTMYEGHAALDLNARYFTTRKAAPMETNLSFATGVDPDGVLARLRGHNLIHGPDNQVAYRRWDGTEKYSNLEPRTFQAGDIVEVSIALVVLPIKGNCLLMIPQMRALMLLDSSIRQISQQTVVFKPLGKLKRKRLYATESTDEEARDKMARMIIDGHLGTRAGDDVINEPVIQ